VAFQTYWSAGGEPNRIRFDTSGGARVYYLRHDVQLPPAPGGWKPQAGVLLQTRACPELPVGNFPEVTRVLDTAGPALGRKYFPDIFLGMNPFGPTADYIAAYTGWLRIAEPGNYRFATLSTDASWLEIDGQPVAAWLGRHGANGGRRGEHNGAVQLRPGLHRLDYTQIQFDGEAAAEAAWQPPDASHFEVIPARAFAPVAAFRVTGFESATAAEPLYFEWRTLGQCEVEGAMVLRANFHVEDDGRHREYRWHFGDGTGGRGRSLEHFYPQPGLRTVTLEAWESGRCVATNAVRVRLPPDWLQRDAWRDDIFGGARDDFLHRDLNLTPAHDLTAIFTLADRANDRELLTHTGAAMVRRADEFNTRADGVTFYKLGLGFEHQGDAGDALAEQAYRLALTPERTSALIGEKVKLQLGALLLHASGRLDEAEPLLGGISGADLTGDERRRLQLLRGDLRLAHGQIAEARKAYLAAGGRLEPKAAAAQAAAQLEGASILVEHEQWEDAQAALDRLTFDVPLERMSLGTGLLQIRLELAHKEFQRAFTGCRWLTPLAEQAPGQSELLYDTVAAGLAVGKPDEAGRALAQLLKDFPYSEAAAKAKALWPQP
jgi:hypothetical protein